MREPILVGQVYRFLTVIGSAPRPFGTVSLHLFYHCRCVCGRETVVKSTHLRRGQISSCGCRKNERISQARRVHGESGTRTTKEYRTWINMRIRCNRPMAQGYENYGGRGIRVCDRWQNSYKNFLADMGRAPDSTLTLERIDNDGHYEPSNCCWATRSQQIRNRRKPRLPDYVEPFWRRSAGDSEEWHLVIPRSYNQHLRQLAYPC